MRLFCGGVELLIIQTKLNNAIYSFIKQRLACDTLWHVTIIEKCCVKPKTESGKRSADRIRSCCSDRSADRFRLECTFTFISTGSLPHDANALFFKKIKRKLLYQDGSKKVQMISTFFSIRFDPSRISHLTIFASKVRAQHKI